MAASVVQEVTIMAVPANGALTVDELLPELDASVAKAIRRDIEWYDRHVWMQRGLAQAGAVFIIVAGGSIPLLSLLGVESAGLIASLLGGAIAIVSGLGAYFRWQENWLAFLDTQRALKGLLTEWDLAMLEAKARDSPDWAIQESKRIAEQSNALVRSETTGFLSSRVFPTGR
jgi:hypothetical protein